MSASVGDGNGGDVELNLAPIIDCFTVLITYLLVTASFISLAAVDVGVSATGTAAANPAEPQGPPPMVMTLEVKAGGAIDIKVRGGVKNSEFTFPVSAANGGRNYEELLTKLTDVSSRWPDLKEASVSADPSVQYKEIVKVIRKIQETMPKVFISG
jgi:biopolymer transport protein ExbD